MGICLSRGLLDAAELCVIFDAILIISTLYIVIWKPGENSSVGVEERRFYASQIVAASIGFPSSLLIKYLFNFRPVVLTALMLSIAATLAFVYSLFAELLSLLSLKRQISLNTVTVGDHPQCFWLLQYLDVFVMLVVCINHGLLAHFTFLRVSREAAEFRGLGTGDLGGML